jgi:hypothetical protein
VSAGRGDLEGAAGQRLAADVGEIGGTARSHRRFEGRHGANGGRRRVERRGGLRQGVDGDDAEAFDHRGFPRVARRQQDGRQPLASRRGRDRQHPAGRLDAAVERQLSKQHDVVHLPALNRARGREHAEGDGEVERRPRLADVRRRQVHGDAMRGELEAGIPDRAADAVATLTHARVGQPDHREGRQAEGDIHLDVDREGLDSEDGSAPQAGEHA